MQKDLRPSLIACLIACLAAAAVAQHDHEHGPPDPTDIELSPTVERLINDPLTDAAQRRALQLFHGQWEQIDAPLKIEDKARLALWRWDLDNPAFEDESVPATIRAEAALRRGDPQAALDIVGNGLSIDRILLRARAMMRSGRQDDAVAALHPVRDMLNAKQIDDPAQLTAAARAIALLARLEGRPAQDYHLAMDLLGRVHNEIDRLYWPAHVAEAELLMSKDAAGEALKAVNDALTLNPRASEAWYRLGLLAVGSYQFDAAARCADKLREINPKHLLADLLMTESMLAQKDAPAAREAIAPALEQWPNNHDVAAMNVAVSAMSYDEQAEAAAIARFDQIAPGSAAAYMLAGKYLSLARQYQHGEKYLREAIAREPNWATPHIELGLLLMQSGDEDAALAALNQAARIDTFNVRAANQLELVSALINEYKTLETEHFIIRYKPGIDAALAHDMPAQLERIYDEVTAIFQHRPARKTIIEILPDERHFAVRITGIPEIWTIAASTGDVIAMTPPRIGSRQRGTFDWLTVLRHEFVHTVTLDQTRNRIPHWFTEACAVSVEPAGRDLSSSMLLAAALKDDQLFDMDEINWAFVRPKRQHDRQLAYMQSHWVLEYITQTYGHQAIVDMLSTFRRGVGTEEAIRIVCKVEPDTFMAAFKSWAAGEVDRWGLGDYPEVDLDATPAAELLKKHPHHPEVLRAAAEKETDPEKARALALRFAAERPVDPWPHRLIAEIAMETGRVPEAIAAMEQLDRVDGASGEWAVQLTGLYRKMEAYAMAQDAMRRALNREPYNASYRELAAAVSLQADDNDAALRHITALTIIEPQRPVHFVRLAAMQDRIGNGEAAHAAALEARKIDPDAPVDRFLKRP